MPKDIIMLIELERRGWLMLFCSLFDRIPVSFRPIRRTLVHFTQTLFAVGTLKGGCEMFALVFTFGVTVWAIEMTFLAGCVVLD